MIMPSEVKLRLCNIINTGTKEAADQARKKLEEIAIREMEEEKKNPPPWGYLML